MCLNSVTGSSGHKHRGHKQDACAIVIQYPVSSIWFAATRSNSASPDKPVGMAGFQMITPNWVSDLIYTVQKGLKKWNYFAS